MIGFKSVVHHGWKLAQIAAIQKKPVVNPYPTQSQAAYEFELGVTRFLRNEPWETPRKKKKAAEEERRNRD